VSCGCRREKSIISRKGAKLAKDKKFEARNPKEAPRIETISNDPKTTNSKRAQIGFEVLDFSDLGFILAPVVSDFDIRISDFDRDCLVSLDNKEQ
jgi:hypothetical protein